MPINNKLMKSYQFLKEMYDDDYFPDFLVDKIKDILVELCEQIEKEAPNSQASLFIFTHDATSKINALNEAFEKNESELETGARESMAEDFQYIVCAYGFNDVDIEDVIAPRDW